MRYFLCVFIGLGLAVAALTGLNYSLHELMQIGTCASGGPYVSARECPSGTEFYGLAMPVCIISLLVGGGIYAARGRIPGTDSGGGGSVAGGIGSGLLIWSGLFLSLGVTSLVTGLGDNADSGAKSAGIIIGIVFLPMGGIPLLLGLGGIVAKLRHDRGSRATPSVPAAASGGPNPFGGPSGGSTTVEGVPGSFGGSVSAAPAASAAAEWERSVAAQPTPKLPFTAAGAPPKPSIPMGPPTTWAGPQAAGAASGSAMAQLERLKALRDSGVLSEAEFAAAKAKILEDV